MKHALSILAIALGLLGATACSDEGTGGVIQPICLRYTPLGTAQDGTLVARSAATSTCSFLDVELILTGATDVLGARFTLQYPFASARLDGIDTSNSFLGSDGATLIVNVEEQNPPDGTVAIVVTRQMETTGVTPDPDDEAIGDVLGVLQFTQVSGVGSGDLAFSNESLESPGTPPVTISGIEWFGGSMFVQ